MKAPRFWVTVVALAIAGCTASSEEVRGREDALRDIENGQARVLGFGLPRFEIGSLDPLPSAVSCDPRRPRPPPSRPTGLIGSGMGRKCSNIGRHVDR